MTLESTFDDDCRLRILENISVGHGLRPRRLYDHFEAGCTVDQAAARAGLEADLLSRQFCAQTGGCSLADYAKYLYEHSPQRRREERVNGGYKGAAPHHSQARFRSLPRDPGHRRLRD